MNKLSDIKVLQIEFQSKKFRDNLVILKGEKCANCGESSIIEYHHIVPLSLGGTNNIDNIVPLCNNCHDKAHASHSDLKNEGIRRAKLEGVKFGRKRLVELNSDTISILDKYFNLEIGAKDTKEMLGISTKNKSTWTRIMNEYKEMFKIPKNFRNNIDIINSQSNKKYIKTPITYTDEVESILHRYFNNEIGMKETRRLIGLTTKTQTTWYKLTDVYKDKFNIPDDFKNLIDVYNVQEERILTGKKNLLNKKINELSA